MATDVQYLKEPIINSNAKFFYKDITSDNYEHRIKLNPANEANMDLRSYVNLALIPEAVVKEFPESQELSAFEKADIESEIHKQIQSHKYQTLLQKEKDIGKIVRQKFKEEKEELNKKKEKLRKELTEIIQKALRSSKKNNPIRAMLPNDILDKLQNRQRHDTSVSLSSLNLSQLSKSSASARGHKRYEESAFLKALGLDLTNLAPENIKIDIDKAYEFIKGWRIERDTNEIIRMKVVNEIMSVEEKRASQKMVSINEKIFDYRQKQREKRLQIKRETEAAKKLKEEKKDPDFIKKRMAAIVNEHKDYTKPKENRFGFPSLEEKVEKKKRKAEEEEKKKKKIEKYDGYKEVDKILHIIDNSEALKQNKSLLDHFQTVKDTKKFDDVKNKALRKNILDAGVYVDEKKKKKKIS